MEALIEHHLERARAGVSFNALSDCHALGIDSIVLHDEPENRIRLFYANWHHTLHENRLGDTFSLAIHSHHCNVKLVGLFGDARSDTYAITPHPTGDFHEMVYTSAIGGTGKMEKTGEHAFTHLLRTNKIIGTVSLKAHELHTVYVPMQARAAWLVIEGAEDEHYVSRCWTNATRDFDASEMYKPMSPADVAGRLNDVLTSIGRPSA